MNEREFNRRWSERQSRYPEWRPLASDRPVHIRVDPAYAGTYAGQVAAITAASLISRMSKTVAVEVPSQQVLKPLPWATLLLDELIIQTLKDAHQYGIYEQRSARQEDLRLVVGRDGDGLVIHGCGWGAYCGTEPSPIAESDEPNPFGAAFAAILAASLLQASNDTNAFEPISVDTYRWRDRPAICGRAEDSARLQTRRIMVYWRRVRWKLRTLLPKPRHLRFSCRTRRPRYGQGRECHPLCLVLVARRLSEHMSGRCRDPLAKRSRRRLNRTKRRVVR